jgi:hypothetical protein
VVFEPGSSTRAASAGIGVPGRTRTTDTPGSARSGSRSSKLAMRGSTGTATVTEPGPRASEPARPSTSSAGRRAAPGKCGTRPSAAQPVFSAISRMPSANRLGSPRNRLTRKPAISAASSGSITAFVPTRLAITPAPVDVADQHHRRVGGPGEAHIGDVARAQVDLGGGARALDEDEVGVFREAREAVQDGGQEPGFPGLVVARLHGGDHPALHHHLGADLALRLQQDRVHVHGGRHPGGAGLERLRPADLAAVGGDGGVVRHVLRLERPDPQAPAR